MLSRLDDYPVHQTPEPVAQPASSDRNVYDRYWFNGYAEDGEFYFAVGMGLYPNRRILDCGFSIVRGGEQHHLSESVATSFPVALARFRVDTDEDVLIEAEQMTVVIDEVVE